MNTHSSLLLILAAFFEIPGLVDCSEWERCEITSPSGDGLQKKRTYIGHDFRPCRFTTGDVVGLRDMRNGTIFPRTANSHLCDLKSDSRWWHPCDLGSKENLCGVGLQDSHMGSGNKVCTRHCAILCGNPSGMMTVSKGCEVKGDHGKWRTNVTDDGVVFQTRSRPGLEIFLRCKVYADCWESDVTACGTTSCDFERFELCYLDVQTRDCAKKTCIDTDYEPDYPSK